MNVLVIGANGKVGKKIVQKLADSKHEAIAMVRKEEQMDKLKEIGASNVVLADLEKDFSHAFDGVDAVIFAAGSGGSTGADKTLIVDLWGSIKAMDMAKEKGIKRFVQLSSIGAGNPDEQGDKIKHYMVAKGVADRSLQATDLDYTIVRPGVLTDEDPIGKIKTADVFSSNIDDKSITRADVAHVLVNVLERPNTSKKAFEVLQGEKSIGEAMNAL
ncbi:SDR family oxidoreductase [Virgibacillus sp. NKC19-16]|uniref:SDR family oxidoreductase n=1 Tax=Virgibacillus salidurans TaxID=2831673 RepID=UPI001F1EACF0|nr:SDR family oxidoreductase [Virgibacillus sp. NKC19-16]UJL46730.1 SDR family oxidoreductase [Virgibacillus sp. NKC19-16]